MEEKENYSHHNRHNNMHCNICYSFTNIGAMEMNLNEILYSCVLPNEKDSEESDNCVKKYIYLNNVISIVDLFIMLVSWKLENYFFNL
jgi:hypothetical protein